MIADVERGARAAEQAALSVAEENERLKLRHKEQKLRASEKLFAKAHEVLAKSARTSRPPDSVRMFIAAALLGDQVLGTGAQIGLNPQVAPVFRVVFRRDQISDERRRLEDKFFAEHPEIRRPKNGLEDATRLAAD